MLMAIVTLLKENSTKKKKSATVAIAIFALLAILIPIFLILSSREPAILFEDRNVKITGLYGETIPADEIKDAAILENIPAIQLRTNGFSLGTIRKGYFQMEGMGSVKLFLNSPSGPYIRLQTKHKCIILNFKDTAYTNEVYGKLKEL